MNIENTNTGNGKSHNNHIPDFDPGNKEGEVAPTTSPESSSNIPVGHRGLTARAEDINSAPDVTTETTPDNIEVAAVPTVRDKIERPPDDLGELWLPAGSHEDWFVEGLSDSEGHPAPRGLLVKVMVARFVVIDFEIREVAFVQIVCVVVNVLPTGRR